MREVREVREKESERLVKVDNLHTNSLRPSDNLPASISNVDAARRMLQVYDELSPLHSGRIGTTSSLSVCSWGVIAADVAHVALISSFQLDIPLPLSRHRSGSMLLRGALSPTLGSCQTSATACVERCEVCPACGRAVRFFGGPMLPIVGAWVSGL